MAIDHGLLDRVETPIGRAQALDRHDLLAVEGGHEADARVHGAVAHGAAARLAHHYRARAAVALGAAFLGAAAPEGPRRYCSSVVVGGRVACLDD
jgi:hypothetical protein